MSNIIIAFPNRVDANAAFATVAFSGGSWEASLPLTNLRDPLVAKVARSTDDATASTQFDCDLGVPRNIRLVAIPSHNLSRSARYRVRGSTVSNFATTVHDSGWVDVWRVVYPFGSLAFENPSWWDGKASEEDASTLKQPIIEEVNPEQIARYWRIEFDDTANPDGYVELSRLFIASGYQPTINVSYGAALGHETDTQSVTSLGGSKFYDRRDPRRVLRVAFSRVDADEMLSSVFDMQRELGIDQQVMVILDPADNSNLSRFAFLATMRRLSALEFTSFERGSIPLEFEEVI